MSNIFQQVFLPASKGLITSAPSSLLPDGAFSSAINVRFGDGYVEKVKAFDFLSQFPDKVISINLYKISSSQPLNMIHTTSGLYNYTEEETAHENLIQDTSYKLQPLSFIDSGTFFDKYYFCSLGKDIMSWDGESRFCKKVDGLYSPTLTWTPNHTYKKGDIIKPKTYSGYTYKCTREGVSSGTEPKWAKDLSTENTDGGCLWVGTGSLEVEGNSAQNVQAQTMESYKGFLFLGNTTEDGELHPYRLRWSQYQNPNLWHNNDDGSGLSGYVDIDDSYGRIILIRKLNDILVVYKEDSIIAISYTGGDSVFSKELITTRAGAISPKAIIQLPHTHVFVGKDNIYQFDGNTVVPIGDAIKDWFFQSLNPSAGNNVIGYFDEDSQDIIFAFDSTQPIDTVKGSGKNRDRAITYNLTTKTWSTREMYVTGIGQMAQAKDRIIDKVNVPMNSMTSEIIDSPLYLKNKTVTVCGDESGKLYRVSGYTDSRGDYDGYVITKTHHMEDPGHIKRLCRIQFHIEAAGNFPLYVSVGTGWNAESKMQWTRNLEMELGNPTPWYSHHVAPFIDVDLSARYFQIRFGTKKNAQPFRVLGYTLYYQRRGEE